LTDHPGGQLSVRDTMYSGIRTEAWKHLLCTSRANETSHKAAHTSINECPALDLEDNMLLWELL